MSIDNTTKDSKARYWVAVGYPENMRDDWQSVIGEVLQLPYVYCIHDKDLTSKDEEDRKVHVHIMIAFPNTTTYKNALSVFRGLNANGKEAFPTCKKVVNVRWMHDYLIHDTEDSRKKGKHLYDPSERISGNNFDIGAYEQLSLSDKRSMKRELMSVITENGFMNFYDFMDFVISNYSDEYVDIAHDDSAFFERLTRGLYLKWQLQKEEYYDYLKSKKLKNESEEN